MKFCGCKNPNIVNITEGSTLIVKCLSCGYSVATTNPDVFKQEDWELDETFYSILLNPKNFDKKTFVRVLRQYQQIEISKANQLYSKGEVVTLVKEKSNKVYNIYDWLTDNGVIFEIEPAYPYK